MPTQEVPAKSWLNKAPARLRPGKSHAQTAGHPRATQPVRTRPAKSRTHASLHTEHIKSYVTEARDKAVEAVTHALSNVRCVLGA